MQYGDNWKVIENKASSIQMSEATSDLSLRITEIFPSLQGEARDVGRPTVFVRLTGCPLRCTYCDTAYAFHGGEMMLLEDVLARVKHLRCRLVCVTGGEPLAQPNCIPLLHTLVQEGFHVSLETSGAMDIAQVPTNVSKVMDLKTPSSKECHRNRWENVAHLTSHDQVKFVIMNREDFEWAVTVVDDHQLIGRVGDVLFSPSYEDVAPRVLADWVVESGLQVRFQLQLHKVLWNDEPGR